MEKERVRMSLVAHQLPLPTWGGRRAGAGRKPSGRSSPPHRARPEVQRRFPLHVTLRALEGVPSLRRQPFRAILGALALACDRFDTRVVHFSVQSNHVHLLMESEDGESFERAMRGLTIRLAR